MVDRHQSFRFAAATSAFSFGLPRPLYDLEEFVGDALPPAYRVCVNRSRRPRERRCDVCRFFRRIHSLGVTRSICHAMLWLAVACTIHHTQLRTSSSRRALDLPPEEGPRMSWSRQRFSVVPNHARLSERRAYETGGSSGYHPRDGPCRSRRPGAAIPSLSHHFPPPWQAARLLKRRDSTVPLVGGASSPHASTV